MLGRFCVAPIIIARDKDGGKLSLERFRQPGYMSIEYI